LDETRQNHKLFLDIAVLFLKANQQRVKKWKHFRLAGTPIRLLACQQSMAAIGRFQKGDEIFWQAPLAEILVKIESQNITPDSCNQLIFNDF
jgi:hypothetical protein